jgi:hypothetical protein
MVKSSLGRNDSGRNDQEEEESEKIGKYRGADQEMMMGWES